MIADIKRHKDETPIHEVIQGYDFVYLGRTESVYNDTPGGLDDLWVFIRGGKPCEGLRAWGLTKDSSNYRMSDFNTLKAGEADPYLGEVIIRAREAGYSI